MKNIEMKEIDLILKEANKSFSDYTVDKFTENLKKTNSQIKNLEGFKNSISSQIKEIRTNWNTLEELVKKISNVNEKVNELKEEIGTIKNDKQEDTINLQKSLADATQEKNALISQYFNNLGSYGKKSESEYHKQIENNCAKNLMFTPLHNVMLQTMDQNKGEIKDKIYNLKRKKIEEMNSIKESSPYFNAFLTLWKNNIKNGDFPQGTKDIALSNNQAEQYRNSLIFRLNFLTEALDYDPKKLTSEFIEKEVGKKAYELKDLVEKVNKNRKLANKLKDSFEEGELVFSKAFLFKKEHVKNFEQEVKKSLENPSANPPQITIELLDAKIMNQFCKVDLLKENLTAVMDANKFLQREKVFESSPGFDMYS